MANDRAWELLERFLKELAAAYVADDAPTGDRLALLERVQRKMLVLDREYRGDAVTVVAAVEQMQAKIETDGEATCPCCSRPTKIRPRTLHAEMIQFLVELVDHYQVTQDWVPIKKLFTGKSGDYGKLVHWELTEAREGTPGFWRPTALGVQFVLGEVRLPITAHLLAGRCVKRTGSRVSIRDVLCTAPSTAQTKMNRIIKQLKQDLVSV
jgi:hypothetical protein